MDTLRLAYSPGGGIERDITLIDGSCSTPDMPDAVTLHELAARIESRSRAAQ